MERRAGDLDELAAVVVHEMAHLVCRDSADRLSFMQLLVFVHIALNMLLDFGGIAKPRCPLRRVPVVIS